MIVEGALNGIILPTSSGLLDGVEIEPGTRGGSKIWIGKDYSNPIHKDFCDLHKPYEGMHQVNNVVPRVFLLLFPSLQGRGAAKANE